MPSHTTSWRCILIVSFYLRLVLPNDLFPSGFPTRTQYTPLLSPIRATCPAQLILLDLITRTMFGKEYRSLSFSSCSLLHFPVTSSSLTPSILLSTLFSNTFSLHSSINVSDQVLRPNKRKGKIIVLLSSPKNVETGYETCPTSYSLPTMSSYPPGVKRPGREADCLRPPSARMSYTPTSPILLHGVHWNNFTF